MGKNFFPRMANRIFGGREVDLTRFLNVFFVTFWSIAFVVALESDPVTVSGIPNPKVANPQWHSILDQAELLTAEEKTDLQNLLTQLEAEKGSQIAIVLLSSIGESDSKEFAHSLFQHWGVGRKDIDDGLLFLMVMDQRRWVFETGYGLEGTLPDVMLKRIGEGYLVPKLREGKPGEGLLESFTLIAEIIRKDGTLPEVLAEPIEDFETEPETYWGLDEDDWIAIIIMAGFAYLIACGVVIALWIEAIAEIVRKESNVEKRLKQLSGIFLNRWFVLTVVFFMPGLVFVIFSFLRNWIKLRNSKKNCPQCGNYSYELVTPKESLKYMDKLESIEHKLDRFHTLVWLCRSCKHQEKIRKKNLTYDHHICPSCGNHTLVSEFRSTKVAATYTSTGVNIYEDVCRYCDYRLKKEVTTPVKERPQESSSSSSSSRGVSYSRSSSSSSSSRSSWGGGRSGGGGASGGW